MCSDGVTAAAVHRHGPQRRRVVTHSETCFASFIKTHGCQLHLQCSPASRSRVMSPDSLQLVLLNSLCVKPLRVPLKPCFDPSGLSPTLSEETHFVAERSVGTHLQDTIYFE